MNYNIQSTYKIPDAVFNTFFNDTWPKMKREVSKYYKHEDTVESLQGRLQAYSVMLDTFNNFLNSCGDDNTEFKKAVYNNPQYNTVYNDMDGHYQAILQLANKLGKTDMVNNYFKNTKTGGSRNNLYYYKYLKYKNKYYELKTMLNSL